MLKLFSSVSYQYHIRFRSVILNADPDPSSLEKEKNVKTYFQTNDVDPDPH